MTETELQFELAIPPNMAGVRADKAIAKLLPQYSRAAIQQWLKMGNVIFADKRYKPSDKLRGIETLLLTVAKTAPAEWLAQPMPIEILFRDKHIFILNKSAGLVVHPGAGNPQQTLLNGLLHIDPDLRTLPRAGIVHRLDKGTSGLMVVARTELATKSLSAQLKTRSMRRQYIAVANGVPVTGETIDQPIARRRHDRLRMGVTARGKPAITHIRVRHKFRCHSVLDVSLETGRTHQIRVHLSWRGFPIVGDPLYGGRVKLPTAAGAHLRENLQGFGRQALHAHILRLQHPATNTNLQWQQPMPQDMQQLVSSLDDDCAKRAAANRH